MNDDEIDALPIVRWSTKEEPLEPRATRWLITFNDGMVAETIMIRNAKGEESHWEARIVEPHKAHLRTQFATHNAAYRFLCREHVE